jgi:RNA polymerase II subunit A C-terminal domain phosphatase
VSLSAIFLEICTENRQCNRSDIGMWSRSFGARVSPNLTKSTTHVVAHKDRRTSKVRQAARHSNIKIVAMNWLLECFTRWEKVPEDAHSINVEREEHEPHDSLPFEELEDGSMLTPSEDEAVEDVILPSEVEENDNNELKSPVMENMENVNWADMEDELADFYDSEDDTEADDDDEGMESDASVQSGRSSRSTSRKLKRKRTGESVNGDVEEAGGSATSALQKRRKLAAERTTGLANVETVENPSGLPSPDTTGPEEDAGELAKANGADADADDTDGDDDFAMAMMAELDRESDAEE